MSYPGAASTQIRDYVNSLEAHLNEAHRQAGRLLRKVKRPDGAAFAGHCLPPWLHAFVTS